jgi:hypothetical protein
LLASSNRGEVEQMLGAAAAHLRADGLLVLHDAFLPGGALPPPEVILGALGRRMARGGCRTWPIQRLERTLERLGFAEIRAQPMAAGTLLVTAERTAGRL